jgi:fructokinase
VNDGGPPAAVLVLGECLVDLAPAAVGASPTAGGTAGRPASLYAALPGGGPANVAIGLARLGVSSKFAGRFSRSGFGPWLRQNLAANGVGLELSVEAAEPATLAVVTLDDLGRASYTFYGPETADWHWRPGELPGSSVPSLTDLGIAAVHTGSLVATLQPSAGAIAGWLAKLRQEGKTVISFDPNVRPGLAPDEGRYRLELDEMISSAHIVKASEDDLDALYPGAGAQQVAEKWLGAGAWVVIVTRGEHPALAFHRGGLEGTWSPPRVDVVDTIGAGDAFSSGFLAYLQQAALLSPAGLARLSRADLDAAMRQAVAASAFTCTRAGADPPTAVELDCFRRRLPSPGCT